MPTLFSRLRFDAAARALLILFVFLTVVMLAGGSSRMDALGQAVVRSGALAAVAVALLAGAQLRWADVPRAPALLLLLTILLPLLQLLPLPAGLGRGGGPGQYLDGLALAGVTGARPVSLVPDATRNALFSLLVPLAAFMLIQTVPERERRRLVPALLAMVLLSGIVGLIQFTGANVDSPLLNQRAGSVGGLFSNRNHQALFLAIGILAASVWGFDRNASGRRGAAALGIIGLLTLLILATGSRAGVLLGAVALIFAAVWTGGAIRRLLRDAPRWMLPAAILVIVAVLGGLIYASIAADRAVSFTRLLALDIGEDSRSRAAPIVAAMVGDFLPLGTGLGAFDPVYRAYEPDHMLKTLYFNQAHNDYLQIVLEAGIPGLLVLGAAIIWWAWRSAIVWRATGSTARLAQLGSAAILLVMIASIVDYPARTPIIMTVLVVAACWLAMPIRASAERADHVPGS